LKHIKKRRFIFLTHHSHSELCHYNPGILNLSLPIGEYRINAYGENLNLSRIYNISEGDLVIMYGTEYTHQYIAQQAKDIWPTPSEIDTYIASNEQSCNPQGGSGDDILEGTCEEDLQSDCGDEECGDWCKHFWEPDEPQSGVYNAGIDIVLICPDSDSSYVTAQSYWDDYVIPNYPSDKATSYYYLGRVAHLLEDATVPAHMHLDPHGGDPLTGDESYEKFMEKTGYYGGSSYNYEHFTGSDYSGLQYNYDSLYCPSSVKTSPSNLFKLFWYTAQKTQYYASDDYNGNNYFAYEGGSLYYFPGGSSNTYLWTGDGVTIVSSASSLEDDDENNQGTDLSYVAHANIPHAMKAVAGLYRLFWAETHDLEPCSSGACCDTSLALTKEEDTQPTGSSYSDFYYCSGTNSPTGTDYVKYRDYYCTGSSSSATYADSTADTCGTCKYCSSGSSSCSNYGTSTVYDSTPRCSAGTGDNNYNAGGEYSCVGYCDGSGGGDYAGSCTYSATCDPDDDDDGVLDGSDSCPTTAGLSMYNGCPDTYPPAVFAQGANESGTIGASTWVKLYANVTDAVKVENVSVSYGSNSPVALSNEYGDLWSVVTKPSSLGISLTSTAHVITFLAYDNSSNLNNTATTTLDVDASMPDVRDLYVNESYTNSSNWINFSAFVNDTSLTTVTLNGTTMEGSLTDGGVFSTVNTTADFGCSGSEGYCVLTISATDLVGNDNNSESFWVYADDLAPRVTDISVDDLDNNVNSSQQVIITANIIDTNISSATINGSALSLANSLYTITTTMSSLGCTPDSACNLTLVATDEAGNVNGTETKQVVVDDTPPTVNLDYPSNDTWLNTLTPKLNYTFTDETSENASCILTINNKDFNTTVNNATVNEILIIGAGLTTNTAYSWYATCTDLAGNINVSEPWTVSIDTTRPVSSITLNNTPNSNGWINMPTSINISATDNLGSGLNHSQWRNSSSGEWIDLTDLFDLAENLTNNIVYYRSIDNAGNTELEKQEKFKYDSAAPVISSIVLGSATLGKGATTILNVFAADGLSGLTQNASYTLNEMSGSLTYAGGRYTGLLTAPSQDGTYNISISISDKADNVVTDDSLQVTVDSNVPTINVDQPNGTILANNSDATVTFAAADNRWYVYNDEDLVYTSSNTLALTISGEEGEFNLQLYANNSEYTVNQNYTYLIDATAPSIDISPAIENLTLSNGTVAIGAIASDFSGISNISLSVDGVVFKTKLANGIFNYPTILLNDGLHVFTLTATDNTGLTNSTDVTLNITNKVIPVSVNVNGDSSTGSGMIQSDNLTNTPLNMLLYSIDGLNSSQVVLEIPESVANNPTSAQLSTVINKINITASTSATSRIYIVIPQSELETLGLTSPYSTIAFYADHGSGVVGPLTSSYDTSLTSDEVDYERFWTETDTYSIFFWGIQGSETPPTTTTTTSGGGSGGSSRTSSTQGITETLVLSTGAEAGETKTLTFSKDVAVTELAITFQNSIKQATITIQKLASKPAETTVPTGTLHSYLKIDKNIKDEDVKKANIKFKVEKSWLASKGFLPEEIVLKRFKNSWEALSTKQLKTDSKYVYYQAETSGFSYFAITAEKKQPSPGITSNVIQEPENEEPQELPKSSTATPNSPQSTKKSKTWIYLIILSLLSVPTIVIIFKKTVYVQPYWTKEAEQFCEQKIAEGRTKEEIIQSANEAGWDLTKIKSLRYTIIRQAKHFCKEKIAQGYTEKEIIQDLPETPWDETEIKGILKELQEEAIKEQFKTRKNKWH